MVRSYCTALVRVKNFEKIEISFNVSLISFSASTELNKLFCWPCLLMRPETSSWCSTGINDVIKFQTLASRHEVCKFHVKAISEYDTMLESFGLFPEFLSSNIKCKSEENSTSESDIEDMFDSQVKSDSSKISKENVQYNQEYSGSVKESNSSKVKTSISFKTWQKINKELFPSTRSESVEGKKVLKWKKRIAKQKFKNAKLVEEKLNVEIELLKAKAEFFKLIKTEHMKTVGKSEIEQISDL